MDADVIIVGGRCAGAATALLLARHGRRVVVVDRSELPSDLVLSTHLVHPSGASLLARWGLLDRVRASGCPAIARYRFDVGTAMLCGTPTPVDGATEAWAPRRSVLDGILIDAAADAGVDVRDRTTLVELLRSEGTVCGVRVRTRNGTVHDMHAPLVIGADGRHSAVVRLVGAPYVEHRPSLQATCFAYWSGLGGCRRSCLR
jgi:2-polyprenyl-6-methoxyphenol hydroxylase-like FAD-dependent oxidoreductase